MRLLHLPSVTYLWMSALVLTSVSMELPAVDRIVLRNLDIVSGKAVTHFDEDGVIIDDGRPITWDQIERGILSEKQVAFDKMEPAFR